MTKEFVWEYKVPKEDNFFQMVNMEPMVAGWHRTEISTTTFKTKIFRAQYYHSSTFNPKGKGAEEFIQWAANELSEKGYEIAPVRPLFLNSGQIKFFVRTPEEVLQDKLGDLCD